MAFLFPERFLIVISKLLKRQSKAKGLFTSAATNQMDCPKGSPEEVQVRFKEGQRSC